MVRLNESSNLSLLWTHVVIERHDSTPIRSVYLASRLGPVSHTKAHVQSDPVEEAPKLHNYIINFVYGSRGTWALGGSDRTTHLAVDRESIGGATSGNRCEGGLTSIDVLFWSTAVGLPLPTVHD